MSDITEAFNKYKHNCNSFLLTEAIDLLIQTHQWNEFTKYQAAEFPDKLIEFAETFREKVDVVKLMVNNVDLYITKYDISRKIHSIKIIREITKCGLAEAKCAVEKAPVKILQFLNLSNDQVNEIYKYIDFVKNTDSLVLELKNNDPKIKSLLNLENEEDFFNAIGRYTK